MFRSLKMFRNLRMFRCFKIFWIFKNDQKFKNVRKASEYSENEAQCPEIHFNKISNTIHKTYIE